MERIARILWHPLAARRLASGIALSPGLIKERGARDPPVPGMTRDLWSFFALPFPSSRRVRVFRPPMSRKKKVETFCRPRRSCRVKSSVAGVSRAAGTDWAATIERTPARLTGWQTLVLLRSLPTIYPSPSSLFFDLLLAFAIRNLCSISDFWPNPFFRSPTPVCVNHASEKLRGLRGCRNILSYDFNDSWHISHMLIFRTYFNLI